MPIQTSQITTETNGDLTISPDGTGEIKVTSAIKTDTNTDLTLAPDGTGKVKVTSAITTDTNSNLTLSPDGTGQTLITSVDVTRADAGTTEDTPTSVAADGTVKKTDLSTLPVVNKDDLVSTDLIAVQKADGDFYKIDADSLSGPSIIDPNSNATLTITPASGTGAGTAGNPYVLTSVTVGTPGETVQTVETF